MPKARSFTRPGCRPVTRDSRPGYCGNRPAYPGACPAGRGVSSSGIASGNLPCTEPAGPQERELTAGDGRRVRRRPCASYARLLAAGRVPWLGGTPSAPRQRRLARAFYEMFPGAPGGPQAAGRHG